MSTSKPSRKYLQHWEKQFKWLRKTDDGGSLCFCCVCNCSIKTLKKANLESHEKTAKHMKLAKCVTKNVPITKLMPPVDNTLKEFEIRYSVAMACHSSLRAVDHQIDIVKKYGKNSVLGNAALHRTKCTCIITSVVSPAIFADLIEDLKKSKFSLLVDESTDISTSKLLCVCVKYFSEKEMRVRNEFLCLLTISVSTGEAIFQEILNFMTKNSLDLKNCIGFSSDGASNLCGSKNSVVSRMKDVSPKMIIVRCICHSLALCCENAFKKLPSNLEFLISEVARWFKCSPLRKEEYCQLYKVMNSDLTLPSKLITPSNTRWLVKGKCIFTIMSQWLELKLYFSTIADSCRSFHARILHQMFSDQENYLYLTFCLPIVQDFEATNAAFQATNANPAKVFQDLLLLTKGIDSRIFFDGTPNSAMLDLHQVNFGAKFEKEIRESKLGEQAKHVIKMRCFDFLKEASEQIHRRLDDKIDDLVALRYLNPSDCLNQVTRKRFSELPFCSFMFEQDVSLELVESQYEKLLFVDWKRESHDGKVPSDPIAFWLLVRDYTNAIGEQCFKELANIVLNAHCIPVSNAFVERVFSHVNQVKNKLRNRMSCDTLTAILRVKTHLISWGICCKDLKISEKMLCLFTSLMYKNKQPLSVGDAEIANDDTFAEIIEITF